MIKNFNERGFVMAEFAIALPLLILLLGSMGVVIFKIAQVARTQAAEYTLEADAQEIIERISADARTASEVEIKKAVGDKEIYLVVFRKHTMTVPKYEEGGKYFPADLNERQRYTVTATENHGYYVYADHQDGNAKPESGNPISGGSFFDETIVDELTYDLDEDKKILHISLTLQSQKTKEKLVVNTSVFMPACKEMKGFEDE